MAISRATIHECDGKEKARAFYRDSIGLLDAAGFPFLIGGAYALRCYTGIKRDTKDLDIFVRPEDCARALAIFDAAGYPTELTDSLWLAKAYCGDLFVDIIFRSGNALAVVDDIWFDHAQDGEVLGMPTKLCPPEETIWSKAFTMERERYDGADILHLLLALPRLDWDRLIMRFGEHWRVLFNYLVLFGYVYPQERHKIPGDVMREMLARLERESAKEGPLQGDASSCRSDPQQAPAGSDRLCQGTLLSRKQYNVDVASWGYRDARADHVDGMFRKELVTTPC